ncbi:MAG TPA: ABC transporter permease [Fastidiosipila sp.]|jgi:D-methionine transport system permease protein|nr:ABC transporter permease [Eubacteriales bacterium]MDD3612093.1 ABC transporter permease [Eubacteriales bacterium]HHU04083.1 ABC transporter permease [Fastidiosipila sp.]
MDISTLIPLLWQGTLETLAMTIFSAIFAYVLGLPLALLLYTTAEGGLTPKPTLNRVLNIVTNILRSIPFLILLIWIMPFTRFIVGTSIGTPAAIVPLVISAAPFVARMIESSLLEVDGGLIEAAYSMGADTKNILLKVVLPEALPSLLVGAAITVTTILGYSTMAGFVGGGGLGAIANNYGLFRYEYLTMFVTVVLIIILVQIIQAAGTKLARKIDKR